MAIARLSDLFQLSAGITEVETPISNLSQFASDVERWITCGKTLAIVIESEHDFDSPEPDADHLVPPMKMKSNGKYEHVFSVKDVSEFSPVIDFHHHTTAELLSSALHGEPPNLG